MGWGQGRVGGRDGEDGWEAFILEGGCTSNGMYWGPGVVGEGWGAGGDMGHWLMGA